MKRKPAEITYPFEVKKGSVSVKIYKTPSHGCGSFTLAYYQDGVRKRPTFPSFDAAKAEADLVVRKLASSDIDVLLLKSAERASYQRARDLLDPLKVSLEVAAGQYAHAKASLGEIPLSAAVEFYLRKHPGRIDLKLVKNVVEELLAAKQADGCGVRYLKYLRYNLGKFEKCFTGNISAVAGGEIDTWLRSSGLSPRTRNNIRTSLHMLFGFAESKRYVPKDHDELESVMRIKDREGDIEVFTPAELIEILSCASEGMIPFLTLGAFAGIRHAEIQRLEWSNVRFDDAIIEIGASKAKTASRRLVPIVPNLRGWLMEHRQASGLVVSHRNAAFELHMIAKQANQLRRATWATANGVKDEKLKQAEMEAREEADKRMGKRKLCSQKGDVPPGAETAGIEGWEPFAWKHNALRHSFISYRVAQIQNVAQVALEAGNSPQMVFSNYRELVRAADAEKWFGITPEAVDAARVSRQASDGKPANVVALPVVAAA